MSTYQLFDFITVDLNLASVIDLLTLLICGFLLFRHGRLAHSHPAVIYLFFHLYTVTARLAAISKGAPTLFSDWGSSYLPVSPEEIIRAALLYDLALLAMTVAWLKAAMDDDRRNGPLDFSHSVFTPNLSKSHIWRVVVIVFPLGVFGTLTVANLPVGTVDIDLGVWERSTWLGMLPTWTGLSLLALIYWYGLRKPLVILMIFYLLLMAYQGFHRFRILIPTILMLQIYLDRHQRKWPNAWIVIFLLVALMLFFPLKYIGRSTQQSVSFDEIIVTSTRIIDQALTWEDPNQQFLDQFASVLTLTDNHGQLYYGTPYLALLVLPIPRPLWPDKPTFASFLGDISRPWRPMGQAGMIATFLGEVYVNFWLFGIIFVPFGLAFFLARIYFRAYRYDYFSVTRFGYLLIVCNLIQVYRDGLTSIVIFVLVNMMPLVMIIILHIIYPSKPSNRLSNHQPALPKSRSFYLRQ